MKIYKIAGCSDCGAEHHVKNKKGKKPGYTWMKKDKNHSGKMDTQMYPECEGTIYDRNIQKKRKNVHAQMSDVVQLETEDEEFASEVLSDIANKAIEGNTNQQQFLSFLWDGENWDSIKEKLMAEGSTWYVWWMDGVRKLMSQLDTKDVGHELPDELKPLPDSTASSETRLVEAKKKGKKKGKKGGKVNPWAVCHTTVDKDKNPDKYERCVLDIKKKQHQSFNLSKFVK